METENEGGEKAHDMISRTLAEGSKKWGRGKIIIVGEGRAGKTALSRSLSGEEFAPTESTVGINELQCDVNYTSRGKGGKGGRGWTKYTKPAQELEAAMAAMMAKAQKVEKEEKAKLDRTNELKDTETRMPAPTIRQNEDTQCDESHIVGATSRPLSGLSAETDNRKIGEREQSLNSGNAASVNMSAVNEELVMKCLADEVLTNSDLVISVFDYGGQSVFNVIHHLFMTHNGVYVLVFNMEWLLIEGSPDAERCFQFLQFWINSITIHTYDPKTRSTALIALVGTHKDYVRNPADHDKISLRLYDKFRSSRAFHSLLENKTAVGSKGTTNMYFYPVDNTLGMEDPSMQDLMNALERAMENSEYTQRRISLTWLHALDELKKTKKNCLPLSEVYEVTHRCLIADSDVSHFLHFLHEMGIVLWLDESRLREVVILDAVSYFVAPITTIICKHSPDSADPTNHSLPAHKECQRLYESEWDELMTRGLLTQVLLKILWQPYLEHTDTLIRLMIKFGLLVHLYMSSPLAEEDSAAMAGEFEVALEGGGGGGGEEGVVGGAEADQNKYLVPALLPLVTLTSRDVIEWSDEAAISTCLVVFTTRADVQLNTNILQKDLVESGFLPSGLFERIVGKTMVCCQNTSLWGNFKVHDMQLYRNMAVLSFGNQRFRLTLTEVNCIRVDIEGHNPLSVHERLLAIVQEVLESCMKELKCFSAVFYSSVGLVNEISEREVQDFCLQTNAADESPLLLIPLEQLRIVASTPCGSLSKRGRRKLLSDDDIRRFYGPWLLLYDLRERYDIFLSYRWGEHDGAFAMDLFDMFTNFSKGRENDAIDVFLDKKRLQDGRPYDKDFAKALMNSAVIVPVVSVEALNRMVDHNFSGVDNLLLEWILAIYCFNSEQCVAEKVFPIAFGPLATLEFSSNGDASSRAGGGGGVCSSLFSADILSKLPKTIPTATLRYALQLIRENGLIDPLGGTEAFMERTVHHIVNDELLKFQLQQTWTLKPAVLVEKTAAKLVELLNQCKTGTAAFLTHVSGVPTGQVQQLSSKKGPGCADEEDLKTWLNRVLKGLPPAKIDIVQQSFEEQDLCTLDLIRESLDVLTADFLTNQLGLKAVTTHAKVTKALAALAQ